ncbi:uncharacterized membrane protein YheB (UPF0754 family) [Alkalibacillus filiformis]|uniref:Uncharacterized membrane protein YheB (UPF0754 family) n=1 Tax=Alkalibacillus filiformis TaxID=200990 RepID=A0ABU0DTP6_9BACI|nr:DUF445 family protein [Alkalibacillus filiformis]MDQ0351658.1 uncharacterized membrane protein YheB (UPF0754 family) [Alkalibacillus filiformis]
MSVVMIMLMMIAIGAIIGGMTNFLAIKMLFKPYKALYIGKWKVPFTPGLIPKRQEELAEQLGSLVTNHLVTADAISDKLKDSSLQAQVTTMIHDRLKEYLKQDPQTIGLLQQFHEDLSVESIENTVKQKVHDGLTNLYDENQSRTLSDVLPDDLKESIDRQLPLAAKYILQQVDDYINSREGQNKLSESASSFLATQGFLGSMVSSYLGEEGLVEKITPAINQFIRSNDTEETVETLLRAEWLKWQHKELSVIRERFFDDTLEEKVSDYLLNHLNVEQYLNQPISKWYHQFEHEIISRVIPNAVELLFDQLAGKVKQIMETFNIAGMVQKEVNQFDVARLEKMVLEITKREFNMITYLGAVLGGTIGFVQGIIVLFIS